MSQFYTKGTIKIKNADGVLEPFLPNTKEDCVVDMNSGTSLSTIIENMEDDIEVAANSGGVKVTYDEVSESNASSYSNETMIAWIQPETWSYTVDTRKLNATNAKTSIPFNLYGINDVSITVDWGDGTTSTFTKNDYPTNIALGKKITTGLVHTYSEYGIYTVTVTTKNFDKINFSNIGYNMETNSPLHYFCMTVIKINNILPTLNNSTFEKSFSICENLTSIPNGLFDNNTQASSFDYCFERCYLITSIPEYLFKYNTNATSFNMCFYNCTSLTSIPTELFKYNTDVTTFSNCFRNCTSLTSIPTDLFKYNTAVTDFHGCFASCTGLTSIPQDLFKYNTAVTDFGMNSSNLGWGCFSSCTSLTTIPQDLFKYNTSVTNFGQCFFGCSSLASIPQDLFKYNTSVTNFEYCFYGCSTLTSIPTGLFNSNTAVTNFRSCFNNCSSLTDFTIHICSSSVSIVTTFVSKKTGTTRTVYVPTGSTTQTTFNNVASTLGLTIIGE